MTRWNANASTETKTGTLKHKSSDMNNNAANVAIKWPVNLDTESTPDSTIFATAATASIDAADGTASNIYPDAHILSSGLKLYTEIFSNGNINNMADKDTVDTTPAPKSPNADTPAAAAQYIFSTDSNSPYSWRNIKFAPYSTNTMKNPKKKKK